MKVTYEVFMLYPFHTTGTYEYKLHPVDYNKAPGQGVYPNRYRFDTRDEAEQCIAGLLETRSGPFVIVEQYTKA